ncbi:hypothetical protein WKW74_10905 [Vibrio alginolyticus]|uniref:hypothetical protein n=1 Tax=Vibrio alginolyticus TaxID=663 RepID=UPI003754AE69
MDWRALHLIYNGLLGKCMLFLALSTPVAILVKNFNIMPWTFVISLIGAIIILLGFVSSIILTPALVKKFSDAHEYADHLIKISDNVDVNIEFSILDNVKDDLPKKYSDFSILDYDFVSVEKTKSISKNEKTLRILSIIKYSYFLQKDRKARIILSLVLAIGSILVFFPTIYNVFIILSSAYNV